MGGKTHSETYNLLMIKELLGPSRYLNSILSDFRNDEFHHCWLHVFLHYGQSFTVQ